MRSANQTIRAMDQNRKWSDAVKARDGKCLQCGSEHNLESHHSPAFTELLVRLGIQSRSDALARANDLWSLDNGFTLCIRCHYAEHGRVVSLPEFPRKTEPLICVACGAAFVVRPSLRRGNWGKCCSRECADRMRSQRQAGDGNPNWKGGLILACCLQCGGEFAVKAAIVKRGHGKFCGRPCIWRYRSENKC